MLIEKTAVAPLLFLESRTTPSLRFLVLPVSLIDPCYELALSLEDWAALGLAPERPSIEGGRLLCLAILTVRENAATANLLAPIVISEATGMAVQAVRLDSKYSHAHTLMPAAQESSC